jgi:hypothetical protein
MSVTPFPTELFTGFPARDYSYNRRAWVFYEQIDLIDRQTRDRLIAEGGWTPPSTFEGRLPVDGSPWYRFANQTERTMFRIGHQLHTQAYPTKQWIPARELPLPHKA